MGRLAVATAIAYPPRTGSIARSATVSAAKLRDQAVGGLVERRGLAQDLRDPVLLDHRGEAIRTQQIDVPGASPVGHGVDLHVALGPERPGDDGSLRVVLGLLVGEPALAPQLLH